MTINTKYVLIIFSKINQTV